jgi:hypothetical protein
LKAERSVLPLIGEVGAEGEIVGSIPGERTLEALIHDAGIARDQRCGNFVVEEREERISRLEIRDGIWRRRHAHQQHAGEQARGGRPRAERFPVAHGFHGQEWNGQNDEGERAELDRRCGSAQSGREVEEALLAAVGEAPQSGRHARHHGCQYVLHE